MKLHNAVQDQPIVSNVGQVGEFRIRNSAKAFNILSSGLYANKIRAIIRELSCNAIDSHVAANRSDVPFDVHLPNTLEPHFSIRDYGTGLSHDQVNDIYTTYFESTKTDSNDFIGALGLGSKSPFSYTDNFTVTTIKAGRKGIYTAFINEKGVPSIALMMEEQTTDPAGVEVRFAVTDRYDYNKFREEAVNVYKYFKKRPVVSGVSNFEFKDIIYDTMNIIPGVHSTKIGSYADTSYAIMGNIAYPINVPESDQTLGDLRKLLRCGLIMEFDIGELDFQASREGLSYIPETIQSIKNKLDKLNKQLVVHITNEANQIKNVWDKAIYLVNKSGSYLWQTAVTKYATDTKFEYINLTHGYTRTITFKLFEDKLKETYNITIRGFNKNRNYNACSNLKQSYEHYINGPNRYFWEVTIDNKNRFVINDTKVGALERAKHHVKNTTYLKDHDMVSVSMFVIEPYDKTKPIDIEGFKELIANPPDNYFMQASSLSKKEHSTGRIGKNVTIMRLEERGSGGWTRRDDMVWRDAGKADQFDNKGTYYYIPISGYSPLNRCTNVKTLRECLFKSKIFTGEIYGVRKSDIEYIKKQNNWIELDKFIIKELAKIDNTSIMGLVKNQLNIDDLIKFTSKEILPTSPYYKLITLFKDVKSIDHSVQTATQWLCKQYDVKNNSPQSLIDKYTLEVNEVKNRYPLLKSISTYTIDTKAVAEYINLIDKSKGI